VDGGCKSGEMEPRKVAMSGPLVVSDVPSDNRIDAEMSFSRWFERCLLLNLECVDGADLKPPLGGGRGAIYMHPPKRILAQPRPKPSETFSGRVNW
jgi:hypothetical protein